MSFQSFPSFLQASPQGSGDAAQVAKNSIVISSNDISDPDAKYLWEYGENPPTELQVSLPSWPLDKAISNSNTRIKVYLRRYFFDCVWRDSFDPSKFITSNSGTSVSKKITLTFFVGPQATTRLLRPNIAQTSTANVDIIITRNQNTIGELASNPYSTVESLNTDLFFENQYTNMNDFLGQPGLYIGDVDNQALSALKSNTMLTVRIRTDREDFPSPFWYGKFLTGVSLWNPLNHQYDIVKAGHEEKRYFKRLRKVDVVKTGGPYFPTFLFKLSSPFRFQLAQHIKNATIADVSDPLLGEFVITNNRNVSCFISQIGLAAVDNTSTLVDLSAISFADLIYNRMTYSDEFAFTLPIYDPATKQVTATTVANDQGEENMPSRFVPYQKFTFPNGVWRGNPMLSSPTAVEGTYSCFPFEQQLTQNQINLLNDKVVFSSLPTSVKTEVLPCHLFVFMDPGSSWLEDTYNGQKCTIGERALQFDLGDSYFINKVQIVFPRSQEDYLPVKMGGSIQRKYEGSSSNQVDLSQAIWFGNYQHNAPKGTNETSDASGGYRYLNTHTQSDNTLVDGCVRLMELNEETAPSKSPYSGNGWDPVHLSGQWYGRYSGIIPNSSDESYVKRGPNTINPAFDFFRQEYGPFVRGCTGDEIFDQTVTKAITFKSYPAEWETKQKPLGHYFNTPEDFLLTTTADSLLKASIFIKDSNGLLQRLSNDSEGKANLIDVNTTKYLYPINFTDTSESISVLRGEFKNVADFLLNHFTVYHVTFSGDLSYPTPDYIVKESYYFAPNYNQYSISDVTADGDFRPPTTSARTNGLTQKMISKDFAQGRYFGFTCGSFLNDVAGNHRYTRGFGNKVRIFSVRVCTQLYSFTSNLGYIKDIQNPPTELATFRKKYTAGILTQCLAEKTGCKYLKDNYEGSDAVKMYPVLPGVMESVFIDPDTHIPLDRADTLVTDNVEALNHAAHNIQLQEEFEGTEPAQLKATMEDDVNLGEYTFYLKAAEKTPLRRFAEIQLDMVNA